MPTERIPGTKRRNAGCINDPSGSVLNNNFRDARRGLGVVIEILYWPFALLGPGKRMGSRKALDAKLPGQFPVGSLARDVHVTTRYRKCMLTSRLAGVYRVCAHYGIFFETSRRIRLRNQRGPNV